MCIKKAGVFYPLQTFSLERYVDWSATPLFVEAATDTDQELLSDLANSLSNRVYQYTLKTTFNFAFGSCICL